MSRSQKGQETAEQLKPANLTLFRMELNSKNMIPLNRGRYFALVVGASC